LIFPAGSDKDPLVSGGRNVRSGIFLLLFYQHLFIFIVV
jgi:hypothetical protein